MNISRTFFERALSLLVTAAAVLTWWGASGVALALEPTYTAVVPISGTASDGESVKFSGQALVSSRLAPDPDFNAPSFLLSIDLSEVVGKGQSTNKDFVAPTPTRVQRRVSASHLIEVTFPYKERGKSDLEAKSALASFTLDFNVNTGEIIAAKASIYDKNF